MDVVLVHPWLGELRRYRDDQLIGSVGIDPSVRVPRGNGDRDIEVLLHAAPAMTGTALYAHADRCAELITSALEWLEPIKQFTVQHAPPGWAEHYAPRSGTPASLLFLDGVEAGDGDGALLVFDFGDLDQLVTRIDDKGNGVEVRLRAWPDRSRPAWRCGGMAQGGTPRSARPRSRFRRADLARISAGLCRESSSRIDHVS